MSADALFDGPAPAPVEHLSAQRRRTVRQATALAHGQHPMALALGRSLALHAEAAPAADRKAPGRRCGGCRWWELVGGAHDGNYPKCMRLGMPVTNGAGTDVRKWWPGCIHHEQEDS